MQHLINYTLHLADNALILGHRNSEWCGHGPVLEQDIAMTNISLDLIGQARNFYQYAASLINKTNGPSGSPATEDNLAYLRDANQFKNCLLAEQPNGDWGQTIMRQFLFSSWQYLLYEKLQYSRDEQLSAIAAKALKEVTYHLRWSSEWVIRLGDGTEESHTRMINATENLWPYTGEFFEATPYEVKCANDKTGVDVVSLKETWENKAKDIFREATLPFPGNGVMKSGGKEGKHSEHLENILAEMQVLQRTYPGCEW